jgi:hypothetical protein
MPLDRLVLRAALRLREVYQARSAKSAEQALLDRLKPYQRALDRACAALREQAASGAPRSTVRRPLHALVRAVRAAVRKTIRHPLPDTAVPDLRTFLDDLRQLGEEFEGLEAECRRKTLTVTTEPIELAGVRLGPFAVRLRWDRLASGSVEDCFAVEALEPHPAAPNAEVTHPHVNGTHLCAGAAAGPIRRALDQGRLADAFLLVGRVLSTYNPASAYVPLDRWCGLACGDCGHSTPEDESGVCEGCGDDLCSDCTRFCTGCHSTRCGGCLTDCDGCSEPYCARCLPPSEGPDGACCPGCKEEDPAGEKDAATKEPNDPPPERLPDSNPEPLEEEFDEPAVPAPAVP